MSLKSKKYKTRRINLARKILSLSLILILSIFPIYNLFSLQVNSYTPRSSELNGLEILDEITAVDIDIIQQDIKLEFELKQEIAQAKWEEEEKQAALDELLLKIENGTTTYRSVFKNVFIVGDSLMNGLSNYDILNEDNMITKVSANLYHLQDNIETIIEEDPEILILHYGLNHVEEESVQCTRFVNLYASILQELIEGLDGTRIIVSSIFPVNLEINTDAKFLTIENYNDAMQEMCDELGIEFLRTDVSLFEEDFYDVDGIHMMKKFYTTCWLDYVIEELELF